MTVAHMHPLPFTRIELAVMGIVEGRLCVLLGRRAEAPHAGRWALPGGVLRIEIDRDLDAAAERVAMERIGTTVPFVRQLCAVGGRQRDPRAPWAVSIVYRALLPSGLLDASPGKRIEALRWAPAEEAATDERLAFDHHRLVAKALDATRREADELQLPEGFLPERFTLTELQRDCEVLSGKRLDRSSFRRKLAERQLVEPVEGERRGGANRPAQVFRLRPRAG